MIPHCKVLSSLVYKRREGPLCMGVAHFESLGVYQFCLGFTIVKSLSRVSNFLFFFFFIVVGSEAVERRNHGGRVQLGLPPPLQRYLLVVFFSTGSGCLC